MMSVKTSTIKTEITKTGRNTFIMKPIYILHYTNGRYSSASMNLLNVVLLLKLHIWRQNILCRIKIQPIGPDSHRIEKTLIKRLKVKTNICPI